MTEFGVSKWGTCDLDKVKNM